MRRGDERRFGILSDAIYHVHEDGIVAIPADRPLDNVHLL